MGVWARFRLHGDSNNGKGQADFTPVRSFRTVILNTVKDPAREPVLRSAQKDAPVGASGIAKRQGPSAPPFVSGTRLKDPRLLAPK